MGGQSMSGHKHATVTISQDEYRRLHDIDMEHRFHSKAKSKDSDSRYNDLKDAYRLIEERQKEYENTIALLNREMAAIEAEHSSNLLSVQADYYQNLVGQLRGLEEENIGTQYALEETTRYFEEVIENEQMKAQRRYDALLEQVSSIAQDQNEKENHAREWIENCKQLSDFIDRTYDHQKFFPKEFGRILHRLNMAIQNLNRGYVDSGLQFAQEAFLQFSELRISLEEKTSQWQAFYEVMKEEVQSVLEDVSNTGTIPVLGIDGEDLNIDIDVDYWSNGKYSTLQSNLSTLSFMYESCKQEITFDDLEKLSSQTIPKVKKDFSDILFEARQNSINSQIKINVAYLAMKALEKHGFSLKQADYKNGDMRDSFSAQLCDEDGSHIILQVTPNKVSNSNNLIIDTIDDTIHTEDEFMRRWEEIHHSLEAAGVQVGQVQVTQAEEKRYNQLPPVLNRAEKPIKRKRNLYYVQPYRAATPTKH